MPLYRCPLDAALSEADAMLYLERAPHPSLAPFVKMYWYACEANAVHGHQRVLPTGRAQIVMSLARDYLTDANHPTDPLAHSAAAIFLGPYFRYQQIDAIDFSELIGVVFHAGGALSFITHPLHLFSNRETPLEDLWGLGYRSLRNSLREAATPEAKLQLLETDLMARLKSISKPGRNRFVDFALAAIHGAPDAATIAGLTHDIGLSARRLSDLFREHVGVSPKLYCRIQRFQKAVEHLHHGEDLRWAELALACGYYDQSHFANDFRAFSGISPSTYSAAERPWANHITVP